MDQKEILVIHGNQPETMVKKILAKAQIEHLIGEKHRRIVLKPNLVVSEPAEKGATTHPELVLGAIEYLQEKGFTNIVVMEGAWVGDRTQKAFKVCGYEEIAHKTGVALIDTQKEESYEKQVEGVTLHICACVKEEDYLINFPVLKGHCQTTMTCALKNMKGLIPNSEKRRFHTMGLMKPIAYLNKAIRQDFIVVDALCGDPDFEEGGNPVFRGQVFAARDPVLCDSYGCSLLGYEKEEVAYLSLAEALGVGSSTVDQKKIHFLNLPTQGGTLPSPTGLAKALGNVVEQKSACSACYANVICALKALKERGTGRNIFLKKEKIAVGQGFQKEKGLIGVGTCTGNFTHHVKGCPPDTAKIIEFFEKISEGD
ncbi:MAG: DUF362 domain-containing protein [Clostridiales bacterium]|nr:DUF362 domain-containing protein [Clostridiales bacterium]